jgi:hypothetical protein
MMSEGDTDNKNRIEEELVDKILGLKDPNSVSAFEVYSKKTRQHSGSNKVNNTKQKVVTNTTNNPLRLVQEAARKFGLTVLSSELEKMRYSLTI